MISGIVIYAIACAAALSLLAICLEQIGVRHHRPRRHLWLLAMMLSIVLPSALIWKAGRVPRELVTPVTVLSAERTQGRPNTTPESGIVPRGEAAASVLLSPERADWLSKLPSIPARYLLIAWLALSAALMSLMTGAAVTLHRRAAAWSRRSVQGHDVLVSEKTGPALIGALRPRIVVPRWFVAEPAEVQRLILEHEVQHIVARDPLLLRAAMLMAIAVPWNLPLWWQFRRLRLCIELDCDARVLKGGANPISYAEVLLNVFRRSVVMPVGVVSMSEPASALAQRVRLVISTPRRHALLEHAGAWALAVAGAAVMVSLDTPVLARVREGVATSVADESTQPSHSVATAVSRTLRLPPPESSVLPLPVMRALIEKFPWLFTGEVRSGVVLAALVLRPDGQVYLGKLVASRTRDPNGSVQDLKDAFAKEMGESATGFLKSGTVFPDERVLKSNLAVRYAVLPQGFDASRTGDVVRSALSSARPDLFLPVSGDRFNRVTVFMTNDGRIDRLYTESRTRDLMQPVDKIDPDSWAPMWRPLGLVPEQLGLIGLTYAFSGREGAPDRKWMVVRYAFPRRAGEPLGGIATKPFAARTADTFDSESAHAIVMRYLPEVLAGTMHESASDEGTPAIALSASGEVIKATRVPSRFGFSPEAVRVLQEQLTPGVQLTRFVARPVRDANGTATTVLFAWDTSGSR